MKFWSSKNKCGSFLFAVWLFFASCAYCGIRADTLTILHVSDTHVSNMVGYHPDLIDLRREKAADKKSFENLILLKPAEVGADLVVHTGDMIDYYEGEIGEDLLQATQIEQFAALVPLCPVPLFMILGNHDIQSYWIDESDRSLHSFQLHQQAARAAWMRNLACFRDGFYYHRILRVRETRYHFLFLDNSYNLTDGEFIDAPQLDWLRQELDQTGNEPVILFMHKYLPALDYDHDGKAFSAGNAPVLNDSTCSQGLLKICNENGNIQLLLIGHGHSRKSELIPFPNGHKIRQVNTGAFVKDTDNWRIVKFTKSEILIFTPGTRDLEWRIPND